MQEEPLGPLFQVPHDPHYLWIFGTAIALAAIAVAAIGLVRGRLPTLLVVPAALLPLAGYGVGYLFVMQESKATEFCGSCHETMSPIVAAMKEDTETLASMHWRIGAVSHAEACYQCHSGYGIWGEVDAKIAGLRHMVKTVTRDYEFPIEARHFDVASCLGCHAETVPFREAEDHHDPDVQRDLLAGEMSCAGFCHEEAHPEEALWGVAGPPAGEVGR